MKRYIFRHPIAGEGDTPDEAWLNAIDALVADPGDAPEEFEVEVSHIKVEYDLKFYGGGYAGVGQFVYINASLCAEIGVQQAFQQETSVSPCHIIHYSEDELFTKDGDPYDD